jgi:5-carboxymethyl-2-hydroxymuconate isomerase
MEVREREDAPTQHQAGKTRGAGAGKSSQSKVHSLTVAFEGDNYNVKYLPPQSERRRTADAAATRGALFRGVTVPHVLVEYSANLDAQLDFPGFLSALRDSALATGVFPLGGIRVRAYRADHYLIADGSTANAFVHIMLRMGHGRDLETRRRACDAIFATTCEQLQEIYERIPLGISLEMQEIGPELTNKKNNLHEYVKRRADQSAPAVRAEPPGPRDLPTR